MRRILTLTLVLSVGSYAVAFAHGDPERPSSETSQVLQGEGLEEVQGAAKNPTFWEALFSHPHNKVVHFPIALGIFAFLFFLLALRWPALRISAELLVLFGFLASIVTVVLGEFQKSEFLGTPQESLMITHERLGWATVVGFLTWIGLMRWHWTRRWAWLIGLGIAALVSITGFFGGQLAHTIGS